MSYEAIHLLNILKILTILIMLIFPLAVFRAYLKVYSVKGKFDKDDIIFLIIYIIFYSINLFSLIINMSSIN